MNPPSTMQDYITYYLFILFLILSILENPLLTSPGSCDQYLLIPVYPIHNFSKCVTGIFSIVTGDDVIRDSCIIDTCWSSCMRFLVYISPWWHSSCCGDWNYFWWCTVSCGLGWSLSTGWMWRNICCYYLCSCSWDYVPVFLCWMGSGILRIFCYHWYLCACFFWRVFLVTLVPFFSFYWCGLFHLLLELV